MPHTKRHPQEPAMAGVRTTLSQSQARELIGKSAHVTLGKLTFQVIITDYKFAYGNNRWLVTPASGSGETWTENISVN
jgi:hypothetical protein